MKLNFDGTQSRQFVTSMKDWIKLWLLLYCLAISDKSMSNITGRSSVLYFLNFAGTASRCTDGDIQVTIVQQNFRAGTISLCDGEEWVPVCHDGWGIEEARVVCRQLGFPSEGQDCIPTSHTKEIDSFDSRRS